LQVATTRKKLSEAIFEAKEAIYEVEGNYMDDINVYQDAMDTYMDAMEMFAANEGALGDDFAKYEIEIQEMSVAYQKLAVPSVRSMIKST
jgi:hypothetical protein